MDASADRVKSWLSVALATPVHRLSPLGGGMICSAARADTDSGRFFVKWRVDCPEGFFAAEADGLERLRCTEALRVPRVRAVADDCGGFGVLALEYLDANDGTSGVAADRALGEGLAELHRVASPKGAYGLDRDNFIGLIRQENGWADEWHEFYRDRRLAPQMRIARERGRLTIERERLLNGVLDRLEVLLEGRWARPVLLHGDLWSGNFMPLGPEAAIYDPAVYYGDREMEIAYMELFGGYSSDTFDAYKASLPLDEGYERRRPLHQLYHLLNHLNHFGEPYGRDVDEICRGYSR